MADDIERKYVFAMKVGADDLETLIRDIQHAVWEIDAHKGESFSVVSGGVDSGSAMALKVNPEQTHENYFREVNEWLGKQVKG